MGLKLTRKKLKRDQKLKDRSGQNIHTEKEKGK